MSIAPKANPNGANNSCRCKNPPGPGIHSGSVVPGCAEGDKNSFCTSQTRMAGQSEKEKELSKNLQKTCKFKPDCANQAARMIFNHIANQFNTIARNSQDIPCGNYDKCGNYTGKPCTFSICSDTPVDYTIQCRGTIPKVTVGMVKNMDIQHDCNKAWEPPDGWPPEWSSVNCDHPPFEPPYEPPPQI